MRLFRGDPTAVLIMAVAVAFSCFRADRVSMRGVVFCPEAQSRLLLPRLTAARQKCRDTGYGQRWVERHFTSVDTSNIRPQQPHTPIKRYFAFARVCNAAVHPYGLGVSFDVFVGPGERAFDDESKANASRRAIHGFVCANHYETFEDELDRGQRHSVSGHVTFCLVTKPDDLLEPDWTVRPDAPFEVVPDHELGAVLLIEAAAHRTQSEVGLYANGAVSQEVRHPLERGFLFRAGLIAKLPEGSGVLT
jgi:hypothetical protein